jgi:hypothetical protein
MNTAITSKVVTNQPGTMRAEMSTDGVNWQPIILRPAQLPLSPPDSPLPEGFRWLAIHEAGKPVRWVHELDVGALAS